jgi:Na+/H+-translocating membrane pyrophosphatase
MFHSNYWVFNAFFIFNFYFLSYLGTFGIALAALGMLSNLAVALAIDGYGKINLKNNQFHNNLRIYFENIF